jgi:fructose-1,6-bisphosphatase I
MKNSGSLSKVSDGGASYVGEKVKKLDVISNEVLNHFLRSSGKVCVIATEEEDEPIVCDRNAPFVVVHDPLDGSSNIEAGIPVGTIIGVYRNLFPDDPKANAMQKGQALVASCYALYSSSTQLVVSWKGGGTHCFTLDSESGDFVLTHRNMRMPLSGASYSVNDGRYADWPQGLRRYIDTVRRGEGRTGRVYRPCYICSLIADVQYTLLHGGVAMNPRRHLRLVYEANPVALIVENAGGRASDGVTRILDIQPEKLHHRLPVFVGSSEDMAELESFGDVQQLGDFAYAAVN